MPTFASAMTKKHMLDLVVSETESVGPRHVLLRLTADSGQLPPMVPGQFVEVRVDDSPATFLRRPISICNVDETRNELWLLVAAIGEGTRRLARLHTGEHVNCILPLGHGFGMAPGSLLVGGGVGVAPLLYLGRKLHEAGMSPTFLLGARTAGELLLLSEFERYGRVLLTTEDGTAGERGFVTGHSILRAEHFAGICCCGPKPMMMAVARYARACGTVCEVSLENMMACGLGACLCCVEPTVNGNLCVCTDGPVFNIDDLQWQI